jgi:hypothetical protein
MRPLVITTCTARKRAVVTLAANQLPQGTQLEVEREWLDRLKSAPPSLPADQLYGGHSFKLALEISAALGADLGIVSAGLGYVASHVEIPSYDLTISGSHANSIRKKINGPFNHGSWWRSVQDSRFGTPLQDDLVGRPLIVMCLSAEYGRLISADLKSAAAIDQIKACTRIFGLSIQKHIPEELRDNVIPYDERLNALGRSGTRVNFAQRAASDFVENFDIGSLSLDDSRKSVRERLEKARTITASI